MVGFYELPEIQEYTHRFAGFQTNDLVKTAIMNRDWDSANRVTANRPPMKPAEI